MPDDDLAGDAFRVHVDRSQPLPDSNRYLFPPCYDAEGNPLFFGSATFGKALQPCKITLKDDELICSVPHRLVEHVHQGSFTVLPFIDSTELVPTSYGRIPPGCRPVVGGADEKGRPLYHAVAWVRGERIPGRTSEHLGAGAVLVGGREHYVYDAYEILCWRDDNADWIDFPLPGSYPIERPRPDQGRIESPAEPLNVIKPGEQDPAATTLRITISDASDPPLPISHLDPVATDLDGTTPLHFGSVTISGEVLPGKVVRTRTCQVLREGLVVERSTEFNILPFNEDMELVPALRGIVPQGRRPVEGNSDAKGRKLYHAMLYVVGRKFPGMCAEHLGGAQGILQGRRYAVESGYDILCWKEHADPTLAPTPDPSQPFSYKNDLGGQRLRVPLNANEPLTTAMVQPFGEYISNEMDTYQWFIASAFHDGAVLPCFAYIGSTPCHFANEGTTFMTSKGPYCVLPYLRDRMEFVEASGGQLPVGRTPVEGGRDQRGRVLYHALGYVSGNGRARMLGMAAEHLGGAAIVCWGRVHRISSGYDVLCWKD